MLIDLPNNDGVVNVNKTINVISTNMESTEKPYKVILQSINNKEWTFSFTSQESRDKWMDTFKNNYHTAMKKQSWKDIFREIQL